ncbi:hypothetical protein GW777_05925 [Candidatus Peregrinibacteria bacterium]|nr:hypothetical protein [bacterium]NCQ55824.1 hypothetical protein [Candidatus Parcubacteria bacterium]NCS67891.1 hypothetical protein [Candidatus Peregrinibacteria bacterium]
MGTRSAKELLENSKQKLWDDLYGLVEQNHLGHSPSWPAETFRNNFLCNNQAGVRFAVQKVLEDSLKELQQIFECEDTVEEDFHFTQASAALVLKSDAARVFGFLVDFVKKSRELGIDISKTTEEKLRALLPTVLSYQETYEISQIQRLNQLLDSERHKAAKALKDLEI